jgi:hypothetical protein
MRILDLLALEAAVKKKKGTEEEPYEGPVSESEVTAEIVKIMD